MSEERKTKRPRHTPRYPDAMRREAFDPYCTGLSRRRVAAVLQEKYGTRKAPHASTRKRWMMYQDRWTWRRKVIRRRYQIEAALERSKDQSYGED